MRKLIFFKQRPIYESISNLGTSKCFYKFFVASRFLQKKLFPECLSALIIKNAWQSKSLGHKSLAMEAYR